MLRTAIGNLLRLGCVEGVGNIGAWLSPVCRTHECFELYVVFGRVRVGAVVMWWGGGGGGVVVRGEGVRGRVDIDA